MIDRSASHAGHSAPFQGLRILEYGSGLSVAVCGKAFADLGADVIKVEPPDGDAARRAGPFPAGKPDVEASGQFLSLNANKRGVILDLSQPRDRRTFSRLLKMTSVCITDVDPARLDDVGLSYPKVRRLNNQVVAVYMSAFGLTGPFRNFKGTDLVIWHAGGLGFETPAHAVTEPTSQPPLKLGGYQADRLTGWVAATGAMAAILSRDRTGLGQLVDVSGMEAIASVARGTLILHSYDVSRVARVRKKAGLSASPMFPCKDGYISISLSQEHWWKTLVGLPGAPAELRHAEFDHPSMRRRHAEQIEDLLVSWFQRYTRRDLYQLFVQNHLPCFPVNSIGEVVQSDHYRDRGVFVEQAHPVAGTVRYPGPATRLSGVTRAPRMPAPRLGQHNPEILAEIDAFMNSPSPSQNRPTVRPAIRALPLDGVRVLDFGWFYAAPHTTAWLGALGAEVIRIESNARVEFNRLGATALADGIPGINRSAIWNGVNFSKLGVTLNLGGERGRDLAAQLAQKCDVVVENFSAGVMERLGLGYPRLAQLNPRLVMLSCSALGATGPEARVSGLGPNVQVYAGLPHISGYRGGPPALGGGSWPDFPVGVVSTFAILAALRDRANTGRGQYIDMAMCEVLTSMIPEAVLSFTMNGDETERCGNRHPMTAPHGVYPAAGHDQWIAIAVTSDTEWRALCDAIGHPEWAEDGRFSDAVGRKKNEDALDELIASWTQGQSPYGVMQLLQAVGVACAPVSSVFDLVVNPQLRDRGFFVNIDHPEVGSRATPGIPVKFGAHKSLNYYPAPCLGQHNEYVFKEILKLDDSTYRSLVAEQVIY